MHKTTRALSSLSSLTNTLAYKIRKTKRLSIDVLISLPFTIYSSYIECLRSLQLHLCGPKALHPQNPLQYGPKPLQNGVKTLLAFSFFAVINSLCLVSSTTSLKIFGHVLKTVQLPSSCFPAPTGPQHSLVACP